METRAILRALCAAAMLFVGLAQANGPAPETPDAYLAERAIGKVEETTQRAYGDALASFEAARKQAPDDIGLAVSHCRFLQHYTDPESGNWMLGADEAFQSCSGQLHARWPDAPQVQLFDLNALWGEAAATRGEAIIKSADRWPVTFRRELLSKTSEGHEQDGNATRAGELVLMAVRLGDVSRLGAAAQYLSSVKKFDQAADLLAKASPPEGPSDAGARVEAALACPTRRPGLRSCADDRTCSTSSTSKWPRAPTCAPAISPPPSAC